MATYKGINGFAVQSVASDPSPLNEGQVWYNNATYAFKLAAIATNSWATAASLPGGRNFGQAFGSRTAGLVMGGSNGDGSFPSNLATSLEYDGTTWTSGGTANIRRIGAGSGAGTQTSAIIAGGFSGTPGEPPTGIAASDFYNGTSWTTSPNINSPSWASSLFGGSGTSATYVAGYNGAGAGIQAVENWNGTSWTTTGNMNASRGYTQSAGTQTAGITFGGYRWSTFGQPAPGGASDATENFNGSTWTTAPNMPSPVYAHTGTAGGSQTAVLAFGGTFSPDATTVIYNGSSWASTGSMITGRGTAGGFGTSASGVAAGGSNPTGILSSTEHFNDTAVTTRTITTS
jgi:hypothetical protein